MSASSGSPDEPWWKSAVLYQIYPRSFADSDGDGIGDIPGIIDRLEHLEWLGVGGIWISPVTVSPNADWGYDVADFCAVAPELGTLDDVDRLIDQARQRGMRVLLDFVPNHTSDQHPWFLDSRSSRSAPKRDWYVWADPKPDGSPPNNWVSSFGGPAWTFDPATSQSYVHNHLVEQPDLNWWNEEVRAAFDGIMRFWFDRGIAGFRLDVCNVIIKDAALRDNPVATEEDTFEEQMFGQRSVYNANRPEVHDVVRRWRILADTYDEPRVLIGETPVPVDDLARYYGAGRDELDLAFNFNFISAPLEAAAMRTIVEETEAALPADAWPAWTGSNHDMFRFPSRWAGGQVAKSRLALLMLLGLRGTPVLYQGDEIGMLDVKLDQADPRDPLGVFCTGPTTRAVTPVARRCSGTTVPVEASPLPAPDHGSLWATLARSTCRTSELIRAPCCTSPATPSPSGAAISTFATPPTRRSLLSKACGPGSVGVATPSFSTSETSPPRSQECAGPWRSAPIAPVTPRMYEGRWPLPPVRGLSSQSHSSSEVHRRLTSTNDVVQGGPLATSRRGGSATSEP